MAQILGRMERDGLIQRAPDPDDGRRSSRISLTNTALSRLPEACEVLFDGNLEVLSDFTDEEGKQLIALVTRMIASLDRVIAADVPRSRKSKKPSIEEPKSLAARPKPSSPR